MKKNYFKLILLLVVGALMITNFSCKKEKTKASSSHDGDFYIEAWDVTGESYLEGVISVKLIQHLMGEKGMYGHVVDADYVNNGFKFKMPSSYPDNQLFNISELFEHALYSNTKTLFTKVENLYGFNPKSDPDHVGTFHFGDENYEYEQYRTHWIYVNQDVEVTGEYEEERGGRYLYKYKYNTSLTKGWNLVYEYRLSEIDEKIAKFTYSFSDVKPTGVTFRWYFLNGHFG